MKFISFLKHLGTDVDHAFARLAPLLPGIEAVIMAINPGLGLLFSTTANVVLEVEQKFALIAKDQKTGTQKAAEVVQILGPVIESYLQTSDKSEVEAWVKRVADLLNAIPVPLTSGSASS